MKTTEVRNNIENKNVSLTVCITLPYKEKDLDSYELRKRSRALLYDIIGQFSSLIIKALQERMEACTSNLVRHQDDIIHNDGQRIEYVRQDKTHAHFSLPAYEAMRNGIKALQQSDWNGFVSNKMTVLQAIKALYFVERSEDKSGSLKFSDLINSLTEIAFTH